WHRLDLHVMLPTQPYDSVKIALDKQGNGRAVFANLDATSAEECEGAPIVLSNLLPGDWSSSCNECMSGRCSVALGQESAGHSICAGCLSDSDCKAGMLCGEMEAKHSDSRYLDCVAPNSAVDGDACSSDRQCAHGHCPRGVCDECAADADCDGDRA